MKPSQNQEAIYAWVVNSQGHAVVEAVAGSGKTTTLVELLKKIDMDATIQFLAFNKEIVTELQSRVPMHVNVSTTNSFGNRIVREYNRSGKFDQWKTWNILKPILDEIGESNMYPQVRNQVKQIVGLYKASYDGTGFTSISDLIDTHGITFPNRLKIDSIELCERVCKACLTTVTFDFDDQIFLPVYMGWTIPKYDWVCIDEAQDLNPVQLELIARMLGNNSRLVAVGDPAQSIYAFRGAGVDSIPSIVKRFNAAQLPLSVCYRCPKLVVAEAKTIVSHIEAFDGAIDGEIKTVNLRDWEADGVVLCRTTAPLVGECLRLIRKGKSAIVKGRDIGEGLMSLFKNTGIDENQPAEDIIGQLEQHRQQVMVRYAAKPDSVKVAINDQIDTLVAIMEFVQEETNVGNHCTMGDMVDRLFGESVKTGGILLCTIHRSKGKEYDDVAIIRPDLLPHPKCTEPWQRQQEMNLKYVAITRAKKTLTWVVGEKR